jgi:Tfp pilus assembly protein PilF
MHMRSSSVAMLLLVCAHAAAAPSPEAVAATRRGSKAIDKKDITQAIKELRAAVAADASYAPAWMNLGWALF